MYTRSSLEDASTPILVSGDESEALDMRGEMMKQIRSQKAERARRRSNSADAATHTNGLDVKNVMQSRKQKSLFNLECIVHVQRIAEEKEARPKRRQRGFIPGELKPSSRAPSATLCSRLAFLCRLIGDGCLLARNRHEDKRSELISSQIQGGSFMGRPENESTSDTYTSPRC
jgi:hypothetical protein